MNIEPIEETKHEALLLLVNPLINFINANNYSYFFIAGKDGTCSRYLSGNYDDLRGMIEGIIEAHPQFLGIVQDIMNEKINK